jgi:imidazolonepropionase
VPTTVKPLAAELPTPDIVEVDLLIHSAAQVLTLAGGPQRGSHLGELGLIEQGAVAVRGGRIVAVGPTGQLRRTLRPRREIDATGQVVLPGFVDPHTHLVWAGDRAREFEQRLQGKTYMEILEAGGGILSTVRQTRAASSQALVDCARRRLSRMAAHGTTTVEGKTGYGLAWEPELRLLEVMLELDDRGPLAVVPTFLPAHAIPPEFAGQVDRYVAVITREMLPALRAWWGEHAGGRPLPFVDVFCERGAFDLAQTRAILTTAAELGYPLKVHVDEFASLGGVPLAVELGAVSVDHLVHTPADDLRQLAASSTVGVALPCTPFGLGESAYAPARELLAADGLLALASDLNPGTAWCESMQFVIALACRSMRLTPAEAIAASTINAAAAVGRADQVGSLEVGKTADLILLEVDDYRHLAYRFGTNLVTCALRSGSSVEGWEARAAG